MLKRQTIYPNLSIPDHYVLPPPLLPLTYIENVKNEAPIVGLTLRVNVFPTCLSTSDVLPTPRERIGDRIAISFNKQCNHLRHQHADHSGNDQIPPAELSFAHKEPS